MKRYFRKLNRRTIVTFTFMLVIFVMSLGYAALSQFIEIEGVALIDRTWNIKVTNVTSVVEGEGVNVSSPYVGSTVTMNANLPTSTSKVTYTITLENQGNIRARLHSIDKVTDKNTNITYTISGVTEGTTRLGPGETNTVTVTVNYVSGTTNTSNIKKSIMLSFNYVEDTGSNAPGGTVAVYDEYSLGDQVTLLDGSKWTVVKDSNLTQEYVTLWAHETYGSTYKFDSTGSTMYDPTSPTNIGYVVNNTILPAIKTSLTSVGGDVAGLSGRLITYNETNTLLSYKDELSEDVFATTTWLMTEYDATYVYYYLGGTTGPAGVYPSSNTFQVRPVIVVKKSNITTEAVEAVQSLSSTILLQNVAYADNTSSTYVSASTGISFSAISSDTNGQGLYYTSTNTEDSGTTYYFRGAVTNNNVQFGTDSSGNKLYWKIVRINEDGTIRLIYNGTSTTATGTSSVLGGTSFFSLYVSNARNAYLGYMYGSTASGITYAETHANTNSSHIKTVLDTWYSNNLERYGEFIADSGFCNDRSLYSGTGIYTTTTVYNGYNRIHTVDQPQFACPTPANDLFTLTTGSKGNKALSKPIGLLTADEAMYAGAIYSTANSTYYLKNGVNYWTMTPQRYYVSTVQMFDVGSTGRLYYSYVGALTGDSTNGVYVRPVINLVSDVALTSDIPSGCTEQNGTTSCPYIIDTGNITSVTTGAGKYTVTTSSNSTSRGTVSPSTQTVVHGLNAVIRLSEKTGYAYDSVSCTGTYDRIFEYGDYLIIENVQSDLTCTANFYSASYTVEVSSDDTSYGTVSPSSQEVDAGDDATITLSPKSGYQYSSFDCDGDYDDYTESDTELVITGVSSDLTCTVYFEEKPVVYVWQKHYVDEVCEPDWDYEDEYCASDSACSTYMKDLSEDYYIEDGEFYEDGDTLTYEDMSDGDIGYWVSDNNANVCYYEKVYIGGSSEYRVDEYCASTYTCEDGAGSYITDITDTDRDAYPDDGEQDGYWYIYYGTE